MSQHEPTTQHMASGLWTWLGKASAGFRAISKLWRIGWLASGRNSDDVDPTHSSSSKGLMEGCDGIRDAAIASLPLVSHGLD